MTRTHLLCRAWLLQLEKPMCHHEQLVYGNPLEYPCHLCCAIPQIHSNSSGVFLLAEQFANLICNLPMLEKGKLYVDEGVECSDGNWDTTVHGGGGDTQLRYRMAFGPVLCCFNEL